MTRSHLFQHWLFLRVLSEKMRLGSPDRQLLKSRTVSLPPRCQGGFDLRDLAVNTIPAFVQRSTRSLYHARHGFISDGAPIRQSYAHFLLAVKVGDSYLNISYDDTVILSDFQTQNF